MPWLGQDFFPDTDSGQFSLHVRAKTGTRIEETARLADLVENSIRRIIPIQELDNILDNIGLPYSTINYMLQHLGPDRRRRRRHPGLPQRESSPDGGICPRAAPEALAANSPATPFISYPPTSSRRF